MHIKFYFTPEIEHKCLSIRKKNVDNFYEEIIAFILTVLRKPQIRGAGKYSDFLFVKHGYIYSLPLISSGLISTFGKTDDFHVNKAIAHQFFYVTGFIFWLGNFSEVLTLSANSVTTTEHRIQGYDRLASEHLLPCTPT